MILTQKLLLKRLYFVPEVPRLHSKGHSYVNIEGYLEKLPSGRKKATFWNAWKKRYFVAKDGVLYYYPVNTHSVSACDFTFILNRIVATAGEHIESLGYFSIRGKFS